MWTQHPTETDNCLVQPAYSNIHCRSEIITATIAAPSSSQSGKLLLIVCDSYAAVASDKFFKKRTAQNDNLKTHGRVHFHPLPTTETRGMI